MPSLPMRNIRLPMLRLAETLPDAMSKPVDFAAIDHEAERPTRVTSIGLAPR